MSEITLKIIGKKDKFYKQLMAFLQEGYAIVEEGGTIVVKTEYGAKFAVFPKEEKNEVTIKYTPRTTLDDKKFLEIITALKEVEIYLKHKEQDESLRKTKKEIPPTIEGIAKAFQDEDEIVIEIEQDEDNDIVVEDETNDEIIIKDEDKIVIEDENTEIDIEIEPEEEDIVIGSPPIEKVTSEGEKDKTDIKSLIGSGVNEIFASGEEEDEDEEIVISSPTEVAVAGGISLFEDEEENEEIEKEGDVVLTTGSSLDFLSPEEDEDEINISRGEQKNILIEEEEDIIVEIEEDDTEEIIIGNKEEEIDSVKDSNQKEEKEEREEIINDLFGDEIDEKDNEKQKDKDEEVYKENKEREEKHNKNKQTRTNEKEEIIRDINVKSRREENDMRSGKIEWEFIKNENNEVKEDNIIYFFPSVHQFEKGTVKFALPEEEYIIVIPKKEMDKSPDELKEHYVNLLNSFLKSKGCVGTLIVEDLNTLNIKGNYYVIQYVFNFMDIAGKETKYFVSFNEIINAL